MKISKAIAKQVKGAKDKMLSLPPKKRDMASEADGKRICNTCVEESSVGSSDEPIVFDPTSTGITNPQIATFGDFLACINNHDLRGATLLLTDDAAFVFRALDGSFVHEMAWEDFAEESKKLSDSFPDFSIKHKSVSQGKDGVLKIHHAIASGTHSGAPYGVGPFPPIEASNTRVVNDPEDMHITFHDGRIQKIEWFAKGENVGPAGLYTQIGGFPLV
ncbi:expressed unknown protein [Seminavis robusta]|uniref:SnoaL-like domain-containing protein n=1 Tax=Seminavis robusta TaxID=568900 RepID=A0A9N8H7V2_9STRA|nr:expressed unknown protein [Seminavis robusta]|eukprot:Sro140_g065440.1 n/a (218) ;mRNA; r:42811-43464